jgi:1,4-alpha-glucan branching enzyme
VIRKYRSPVPGHVRVVFELPSCVWADRISVTGDFNDWGQTAHPLVQNRQGVWQVAVDLPIGHSYQFRYVIDGQWRTDSHADGFADNTYGSQNSVVTAELPESEFLVETTALVRDSGPQRPFHTATVPQRPLHSPALHVAA